MPGSQLSHVVADLPSRHPLGLCLGVSRPTSLTLASPIVCWKPVNKGLCYPSNPKPIFCEPHHSVHLDDMESGRALASVESTGEEQHVTA